MCNSCNMACRDYNEATDLAYRKYKEAGLGGGKPYLEYIDTITKYANYISYYRQRCHDLNGLKIESEFEYV